MASGASGGGGFTAPAISPSPWSWRAAKGMVMSYTELTDSIEQFTDLEARAGVTIRGLLAWVDHDECGDDEYEVTILGEVVAPGGGGITHTIELGISCYNDKGQVCGRSTTYLFKAEFFGLDTFKDTVCCKGMPVRIKLTPRINDAT